MFPQDVPMVRTALMPPVFLHKPLTADNFNPANLTTSTVSAKIENTEWSSTIPATARALIIQCEAADSANVDTTSPQGADYFFALGPTAADFNAMITRPIGGDIVANKKELVPCTKGDLWYQHSASGAGTLNVTLKCWGWWF